MTEPFAQEGRRQKRAVLSCGAVRRSCSRTRTAPVPPGVGADVLHAPGLVDRRPRHDARVVVIPAESLYPLAGEPAHILPGIGKGVGHLSPHQRPSRCLSRSITARPPRHGRRAGTRRADGLYEPVEILVRRLDHDRRGRTRLGPQTASRIQRPVGHFYARQVLMFHVSISNAAVPRPCGSASPIPAQWDLLSSLPGPFFARRPDGRRCTSAARPWPRRSAVSRTAPGAGPWDRPPCG